MVLWINEPMRTVSETAYGKLTGSAPIQAQAAFHWGGGVWSEKWRELMEFCCTFGAFGPELFVWPTMQQPFGRSADPWRTTEHWDTKREHLRFSERVKYKERARDTQRSGLMDCSERSKVALHRKQQRETLRRQTLSTNNWTITNQSNHSSTMSQISISIIINTVNII